MTTIFNELNHPWDHVLWLFMLLLGIILLHTLIFLLLRAIFTRYRYIEFEDLLPLKPPTLSLALLILGNYGLKLFEVNLPAISSIVRLIGILLISWLIIMVVQAARKIVTRKLRMEDEDNLRARKIYTELKVAERILTVLVVIIGLGSALMTFPSIRQLGTSILTTAGIAGIIVGLAAQRVIGGIFAGLQLAITQTIRLDDVVIVEGEWGKIEEIGLTYVVVKIWDKRRLVLPTTYFIEKPFQNWTRISADLIGTVFIHTDYRIPVSALREQLTVILGDSPLWDGDVDVLQVTDSTDRTIELRALVSARNSQHLWDLRVYVRERLVEFMQEKYSDYLPRTRIVLEGSTGTIPGETAQSPD